MHKAFPFVYVHLRMHNWYRKHIPPINIFFNIDHNEYTELPTFDTILYRYFVVFQTFTKNIKALV